MLLIVSNRGLYWAWLRDTVRICGVIRYARGYRWWPIIYGVSLSNLSIDYILGHIFGAWPKSSCGGLHSLLGRYGWSVRCLKRLYKALSVRDLWVVSCHRICHIGHYVSWRWINFELGCSLKLFLPEHKSLLGFQKLLLLATSCVLLGMTLL